MYHPSLTQYGHKQDGHGRAANDLTADGPRDPFQGVGPTRPIAVIIAERHDRRTLSQEEFARLVLAARDRWLEEAKTEEQLQRRHLAPQPDPHLQHGLLGIGREAVYVPRHDTVLWLADKQLFAFDCGTNRMSELRVKLPEG